MSARADNSAALLAARSMLVGARRARARRGEAGFTVIELAVVMLIMVVVVAGISFGLANLRRASLTSVSGQLDGAVRYIYQLSSINGAPYRLVVDMDEGTWWAEALDLQATPCSSFTVKDVRRKEVRIHSDGPSRRGLFGAAANADDEEEGPTCTEEERDADGNCPPEGFGTVKNNLLAKQTLPKGIRFSGLMTTHQQEVQEQGRGYVYFFPNGSVEKAFIFLSDGNSVFTIETFPLLGKVKVHREERDLGDVFRAGSLG